MSTQANRYYDKYKRDQEARTFYKSRAWERCRQMVLVRDHYLCQSCKRNGRLTVANTVHHIKELKNHPELALDMDNLETICPTCHNREHPEKGMREREQKKKRIRVAKESANMEIT